MATIIEPELDLELPIPPRLNTKYKVGKGRVYVDPQHKKYVDQVHKLLTAKRIKPAAGDLGVIITWYRRTKRGDIDGILKTLLDSMTGYAYKDDAQIKELSIFRSDSEPNNPRVVVKIIDLFAEEEFNVED